MGVMCPMMAPDHRRCIETHPGYRLPGEQAKACLTAIGLIMVPVIIDAAQFRVGGIADHTQCLPVEIIVYEHGFLPGCIGLADKLAETIVAVLPNIHVWIFQTRTMPQGVVLRLGTILCAVLISSGLPWPSYQKRVCLSWVRESLALMSILLIISYFCVGDEMDASIIRTGVTMRHTGISTQSLA